MNQVDRYTERATGAIDVAIAQNLNRYRESLVEIGFDDAEIDMLVARYAQQLAEWRREKLIELRRFIEGVVYRGGQSLN